MRKNNNITFINLSDFSTYTLSPKSSKRVGAEKKKPFIVVNSDCDYGFYVRSLLQYIQGFGLRQQTKLYRQKELRSIRTGDLIVFGDAPAFSEYDYRIETEPLSLGALDKRTWKAYDLVNQFHRVVRRLQEYATANSTNRMSGEEECCDIKVKVKITEEPAAQIRTRREFKKSEFNRPTGYTNIHQYEDVTVEDISVFHNWVKIGYSQYDIYVDEYEREFIELENGAVLFVKEDRYGRRYLAK